jgi:hypothetical protein
MEDGKDAEIKQQYVNEAKRKKKDKEKICNRDMMKNDRNETQQNQIIRTVTMKVNVFWDLVQSVRYLSTFRRALLSPSIGYMESVRPIRRQNTEYNNLVKGSRVHNDDTLFLCLWYGN